MANPPVSSFCWSQVGLAFGQVGFAKKVAKEKLYQGFEKSGE